MRFCRHTPTAALRPFVDWLWFYEDWHPDHDREHVLPDGTFELVINLQNEPRKLFDRADTSRYQTFRRGWLSGTHSEYLIIDALAGSSMIGAHFKPGGCAPFLNVPADELQDEVVELDDIWGGSAWHWRDQLLDARTPEGKFAALEQFLLSKLVAARRPANGRDRVFWALNRFVGEPNLHRINQVTGYLGISHKHFIEEFRREVGLPPKLFCRIRCFQQVLAQIGAQETVEWADIACTCGYYDQAHFVNDFQAFAGLNPSAYLTHRMNYPGFTLAGE
jgi:AraC-like DNA-binding protein